MGRSSHFFLANFHSEQIRARCPMRFALLDASCQGRMNLLLIEKKRSRAGTVPNIYSNPSLPPPRRRGSRLVQGGSPVLFPFCCHVLPRSVSSFIFIYARLLISDGSTCRDIGDLADHRKRFWHKSRLTFADRPPRLGGNGPLAMGSSGTEGDSYWWKTGDGDVRLNWAPCTTNLSTGILTADPC